MWLCGCPSLLPLCLPLNDDCEVPTRLLALRSQFVRACCAGIGWSAVATGDGGFFAWGCGELPTTLEGAPAGSCALVCGPRHAFALTDDGEVFTWECGLAAAAVWAGAMSCLPQKVSLPIDIGQLACGDSHTLALAEGGIVFSWGRGVEGQLVQQLRATNSLASLAGGTAPIMCGAGGRCGPVGRAGGVEVDNEKPGTGRESDVVSGSSAPPGVDLLLELVRHLLAHHLERRQCHCRDGTRWDDI